MDSTKTNVLFLDGLTPEAIRSQLSRILSSSVFRESPAASRFLSFVVQEVLSGQSHRIKQYTIAVDAFGYPKDFDPHTSNSMRVLAGRLRVMLTLYYLHEGLNDEIRIEIPKRTYIPIIRRNTIQQTETQTEALIAPVPVSVTEYGLSIAVIPFSQFSSSKRLAVNITDSIVIGLSHFHQLKIVGPLEEYKNKVVKADEIAEKYRVRFVLQGRVQKYSDTLRVNAFLTDARTGFKIWTQTYEYHESDANLLEIEDDVSRQLVNALVNYSCVLISRESLTKRADDLEIYEAISRHEYYWENFSEHSLLSAVEALEHAVKVDTVNPVVLSMLSHAYCATYIFDVGTKAVSLEEAERLARLAVELDPDYQFAHYAEAMAFFVQRKKDRCIAAMEKTISLNVFNAHAYNGCAFLYLMLGFWEEGMKLSEAAIRLSAIQPSVYSVVPFMYHYFHADYEKTWTYAKGYNSGMFWDSLITAAGAGQLGLHTEAAPALRELLKMRPDFPFRARELMQRAVYLEKHVDLLLDGLMKAGLRLKSA